MQKDWVDGGEYRGFTIFMPIIFRSFLYSTKVEFGDHISPVGDCKRGVADS